MTSAGYREPRNGGQVENVSQQALLVFEEGLWAGRKMSIEKDSVIIGRGGSGRACDVLLPDRQVSREHAEICVDQGRYLLRDLDSKNGTYLNGCPVDGAVQLADGDEIQIALAQRIRFVGADATTPLAEVAPTNRLRLDLQSRRVWVGLKEIDPPLSPAQYGLLAFLHGRPGQVCSREEIVNGVWADTGQEGVTDQAIDALVRRLRKRLAEGDPDGSYVVTVRGHGFRLDPTGGHSS